MIKDFDELMSHLNSEDNNMALNFRRKLNGYIKRAEDDAHWRDCLESGGVDNWEWYSECFPDDDDDEEDED